MHFVLSTKGSHQSPNFDISKCSGENCAKFFMSFPKPLVSVSSTYTRHFSVMKDNSCTLFRSNVRYFAQKRPVKVKIFETWVFESKFTKFLSFLKQQISFFSNFASLFSVMRQTPLYFFSWNFIYFQQKGPLKVQIWWNFTWAGESLKFCTLMDSFCPNHIKF